MQPCPRKALAGIDLANGCYIGVTEHPFRRYGPALAAIATQFNDRIDLRIGELWQAARVACIGDLDADGERVDIVFLAPDTLARMPGTTRFGHELQHPAVFMDEIVAGDLAFRPTEPVEGAIGRAHAGIVQQDHIRLAPTCPLAVVRRRLHQGTAVVSRKRCHAARRSFSISS